MLKVSADWVLPISRPPIRGGTVAIEAGRIVSVSDERSTLSVSLGSVAILPALVNAHTHLELSYLHEHVPPRTRFNDWVTEIMARRREYPDPRAPEILKSAARAIASARASGTGLIGDISNTLVTVPLLRKARMAAHVFHELMGFNHPDPASKVREARTQVNASGANERDVRVSLAPHAPYSVSPQLFNAIRSDMDGHADSVSSVHLGESSEEVEFLRSGTGVVRDMLERLGVWSDRWDVRGQSPVDYIDRVGFLHPRLLVVHGVQFTLEDCRRVMRAGATLVSCPRSNQYVGVGSPPLDMFYRSGVAVALGTDSLASVADLNMFAEIAEARRVGPSVPASRLLGSATLVGARALGFEGDYGSIEAGKRASLIAVRVPADVTDVEEYLVSGVEPGAVQWLDSDATHHAQ